MTMTNRSTLPAPSADNQSILLYILSLFENDDDYFGVITLAVQHSRIINIRKEQNLKPAEIASLQARNSGKTYANPNNH